MIFSNIDWNEALLKGPSNEDRPMSISSPPAEAQSSLLPHEQEELTYSPVVDSNEARDEDADRDAAHDHQARLPPGDRIGPQQRHETID